MFQTRIMPCLWRLSNVHNLRRMWTLGVVFAILLLLVFWYLTAIRAATSGSSKQAHSHAHLLSEIPSSPLYISRVLLGGHEYNGETTENNGLRGRDCIIVTFSLPVIPLSSESLLKSSNHSDTDFVSQPLRLSGQGATPGEWRWTTPDTVEFCPLVDWPGDLSMWLAPAPTLASFDGHWLWAVVKVSQQHIIPLPIHFHTTPLNMVIYGVESPTAQAATGGLWSGYWTRPGVDLSAEAAPELPADARMLVLFNHPVDIGRIADALHLRRTVRGGDLFSGVLGWWEGTVPVLVEQCDIPIEALPLLPPRRPAGFAERAASCVWVGVARYLDVDTEYQLRLPVGAYYHALSGPIGKALVAPAMGPRSFRFSFLQQVLPPRVEDELRPLHTRYWLWLPHGLHGGPALANRVLADLRQAMSVRRQPAGAIDGVALALPAAARGAAVELRGQFHSDANYVVTIRSSLQVRDGFGQPLEGSDAIFFTAPLPPFLAVPGEPDGLVVLPPLLTWTDMHVLSRGPSSSLLASLGKLFGEEQLCRGERLDAHGVVDPRHAWQAFVAKVPVTSAAPTVWSVATVSGDDRLRVDECPVDKLFAASDLVVLEHWVGERTAFTEICKEKTVDRRLTRVTLLHRTAWAATAVVVGTTVAVWLTPLLPSLEPILPPAIEAVLYAVCRGSGMITLLGAAPVDPRYGVAVISLQPAAEVCNGGEQPVVVGVVSTGDGSVLAMLPELAVSAAFIDGAANMYVRCHGCCYRAAVLVDRAVYAPGDTVHVEGVIVEHTNTSRLAGPSGLFTLSVDWAIFSETVPLAVDEATGRFSTRLDVPEGLLTGRYFVVLAKDGWGVVASTSVNVANLHVPVPVLDIMVSRSVITGDICRQPALSNLSVALFAGLSDGTVLQAEIELRWWLDTTPCSAMYATLAEQAIPHQQGIALERPWEPRCRPGTASTTLRTGPAYSHDVPLNITAAVDAYCQWPTSAAQVGAAIIVEGRWEWRLPGVPPREVVTRRHITMRATSRQPASAIELLADKEEYSYNDTATLTVRWDEAVQPASLLLVWGNGLHAAHLLLTPPVSGTVTQIPIPTGTPACTGGCWATIVLAAHPPTNQTYALVHSASLMLSVRDTPHRLTITLPATLGGASKKRSTAIAVTVRDEASQQLVAGARVSALLVPRRCAPGWLTDPRVVAEVFLPHGVATEPPQVSDTRRHATTSQHYHDSLESLQRRLQSDPWLVPEWPLTGPLQRDDGGVFSLTEVPARGPWWPMLSSLFLHNHVSHALSDEIAQLAARCRASSAAPTAVYRGTLTDSIGNASLSISIPDPTTEYALFVMATDSNQRYGFAVSAVAPSVSTPAITRVSAPRNVFPGDMFECVCETTSTHGGFEVSLTVHYEGEGMLPAAPMAILQTLHTQPLSTNHVFLLSVHNTTNQQAVTLQCLLKSRHTASLVDVRSVRVMVAPRHVEAMVLVAKSLRKCADAVVLGSLPLESEVGRFPEPVLTLHVGFGRLPLLVSFTDSLVGHADRMLAGVRPQPLALTADALVAAMLWPALSTAATEAVPAALRDRTARVRYAAVTALQQSTSVNGGLCVLRGCPGDRSVSFPLTLLGVLFARCSEANYRRGSSLPTLPVVEWQTYLAAAGETVVIPLQHRSDWLSLVAMATGTLPTIDIHKLFHDSSALGRAALLACLMEHNGLGIYNDTLDQLFPLLYDMIRFDPVSNTAHVQSPTDIEHQLTGLGSCPVVANTLLIHVLVKRALYISSSEEVHTYTEQYLFPIAAYLESLHRWCGEDALLIHRASRALAFVILALSRIVAQQPLPKEAINVTVAVPTWSNGLQVFSNSIGSAVLTSVWPLADRALPVPNQLDVTIHDCVESSIVSLPSTDIAIVAKLAFSPVLMERTAETLNRAMELDKVLHVVHTQPYTAVSKAGGVIPVGSVVMVTVQLKVLRPLTHVVLSDCLPAGLKLIGQHPYPPTNVSQFDNFEQSEGRVVYYAQRLQSGTYHLRHLAIASHAGSFIVPPTWAWEDEQRGVQAWFTDPTLLTIA